MSSETYKSYNDKLIGLSASCGLVVNGISKHAIERMVERNISEVQAADIITNSSITYPGNTEGTICQQKDGFRIVFNQKTGNIITAIDLREDD